MIHGTHRAVALLLAGMTLSCTLTAALAAPPKKGKKHPVKAVAGKPTAAMLAAGAKVYDGNGCMACHAIGGKGGPTGPDLSNVGGDPKHTPKWLETQVVNPKANMPDSTMPPYDSIKGKDLSNLVAYLGSLKKPMAKATK